MGVIWFKILGQKWEFSRMTFYFIFRNKVTKSVYAGL